MVERLSDKLIEYLLPARGRTVNLRDIRTFLKIENGSKDDINLRVQMTTTMVKKKIVKPSGLGDGNYKVLLPIELVKWWDDDIDTEPLDFKFPKAYECDEEIYVSSEFGIEELVEVFAGAAVGVYFDCE